MVFHPSVIGISARQTGWMSRHGHKLKFDENGIGGCSESGERYQLINENVSGIGCQMPEISRFYGIIIYMFFDDHAPPHFHVQYNEYNAIVEIESGEIIRGSLPPKQLKYVQVWADLHKDELSNNFEDLKTSNKNYNKIKPL